MEEIREDAGKKTPLPSVNSLDDDSSVVEDQWTVYMSRVNLPAVLNDPTLSRRETDFFTKTWGDGFERFHVAPSPLLPEITRQHFKKYLRKISSVSTDTKFVFSCINTAKDSLK